jgi:CHASE3 domain sensor protein
MKKTTKQNLLILAITIVVVAGVVLYLKNQQLIDNIDTLIEQGNYNEENDNN